MIKREDISPSAPFYADGNTSMGLGRRGSVQEVVVQYRLPYTGSMDVWRYNIAQVSPPMSVYASINRSEINFIISTQYYQLPLPPEKILDINRVALRIADFIELNINKINSEIDKWNSIFIEDAIKEVDKAIELSSKLETQREELNPFKKKLNF